MTCRLRDGHTKWSMSRDGEGHRTYKLELLVVSDNKDDGPATVLQTPGLPLPGSFWAVGTDVDPWATCKLDCNVSPVRPQPPNFHWKLDFTFSTKPDGKQCKDQQIEDPLLQPMRVTGSFVKYQEEKTEDRDGAPILTSSHEPIRGKQVEFDANRPQVVVEQNVPLLQLELFSPMVDTLNATTLWGFPPRCVKLSDAPWEKKFYGQCYVYYTRKFTFDIDARTNAELGIIVSGFDRDLLDEGNKVLHGHWDKATGRWVLDDIAGAPPDPDNPQHFDRFKDRRGENSRVILDGHGLPAEVDIGTGTGSARSPAGSVRVEYYQESDFLALGIPLVL